MAYLETLLRRARVTFTLLLVALASFAHATTLQLQSVSAASSARFLIDGVARDVVRDRFTDEGLLLEKIDGDYAVFLINGERRRMRVGETLLVDSQTQGFITHQVRADQKNRYMTPITVNGGVIALAEIDRNADAIVISSADADRLGLPYKDKPARSLRVPATPRAADETKEQREQREARNAELAKAAKDGKPVMYKTYTLPLNSLRVGNIDVYGITAVVSEKPGLTHAVVGKPFLRRVAPSWSNRTLIMVRR
jgi:predicted aspartyl protease